MEIFLRVKTKCRDNKAWDISITTPGPKAHATATAKEETSRAPPKLIDDRYQLFAKRLTKIGCEILLLLDDTFVDHIN